MARPTKVDFLAGLESEFAPLGRLPNSQSLFVLGEDDSRIYIRYSKLHPNGRAFFGLREMDLRRLEGHNSFICFLVDDKLPPVVIPYADFEEVFRQGEVAADGQFKVQLIVNSDYRELYVARCGRFNVEGYSGIQAIGDSISERSSVSVPFDFTHSQVQTLLASIGNAKGYDVFVPPRDTPLLDWKLTPQFSICSGTPKGFGETERVLREIDVIWTTPGSNEIQGLFEVEHSTTVYSGLLRFNDALLTSPSLSRFVIVSNEARRSVYARQVLRPTFRQSGLSELASFLDYINVYKWYTRCVQKGESDGGKD